MAITPRVKRPPSESSEDEGSSSSVKRVKLERGTQQALPAQRRQQPQSTPDEDEDVSGDEENGHGESSRHGLEREGGTAQASEAEEEEEEEEEEDEATILARVAFPDDAANVRAYEASRNRKRNVYGASSEAGVIKAITVVNFMNHRHTTVDFGAKMNFLVGHNGSGKSAILTAIAVVLGGKAATTGRGSGLKDLIRKGCDLAYTGDSKAIITLTMTNSGDEAFKPELYDPTIVIERTLSINGSSTYKFRATRDGRTVASKRDELTQMIEHFNITIDSPLTILTQDAARSFLQNATDATLYKFFLEGTQLKSLTDQYETIGVQLETLAHNIQQRKDALPDVQHRFDRLADQLKASERIIQLQRKMTQLRIEAAWAFVIDKERSRDKAQTTVEEYEEKLVSVNEKLEECKAEILPIKEQCHTMTNDFEAFEDTRKKFTTQKRKAKDRYDEAKVEVRKNELALKDNVDTIASFESEINDLRAKIREKQQVVDAAEDPVQVELRNNIEKHENLLRNLQREVPAREKSTREREEIANQAEAETERLRNEVMEVESRLTTTNNTIRNLERQSTNRLSAFGQNLEGLITDINRARWKHSKPIGPLGIHVQLEDERYKGIVSSHLGQTLCSFAVRCGEDKATLMKLMNYHFRSKNYRPAYRSTGPPPVIQHNGERFDFSNGDLSSYGETMLSKLKVDNEDVLRILIVQRNIEKLFVAPAVEVGNRMIDDLLQRGIPNPVILTADLFRTSGTNSSRDSGPIEAWKGNILFTKDVASSVREQREIVDEQSRQRDRLSKELTAATQAKIQAAQALAESKNVRMGIPTAQTKIDRWRNQLEERPDNDISALDASLKKAQGNLDWYEEQRPHQETEVEKAKALAQRFVDEMQKIDEDIEDFMPERERRRDALEVLLGKRAQLQQNLSHWERSVNLSENKVADAKAALEKVESDLTQWTSQAEGIGPRVETRRDGKKLNAESENMERAIREAEKRGNISREVIMPRYTEAERKLKELKQTIGSFEAFRHILRSTLKARRMWWNEIRGHTAVRARTLFIVHLEKRGFNGRLAFSHEAERLSVRVQTNGTAQQREAAQDAENAGPTQQTQFKVPANLSGGERSFSTVALLLAMWDTTTCPIRCLDEWDVFLDHVNRGIAARMLVEGAKESNGKQFILITPQDMSNVPTGGPDTRVVRLNDPERNQATLDFAPTVAA